MKTRRIIIWILLIIGWIVLFIKPGTLLPLWFFIPSILLSLYNLSIVNNHYE